MAQLTAAERLAKVKTALGMNGSNYQDETLSLYIGEVVDFMVGAGVQREVAESDAAVGCIAVGVNDLWNYSSGGVRHSDYFHSRVIQLSLRGAASVTPTERHERIVLDHATRYVEFSLDYTDSALVRVYVNGIAEAEGVDYALQGNTITFAGSLTAGTEIDVYIYG